MLNEPTRTTSILAVLAVTLLIAAGCDDPAGPVEPENDPPTAAAGVDLTSPVLQTVTLDGSASTDPEGEALSYDWTVVSAPAGSSAALADPQTATPSFEPDAVGSYEFELTVSDGVHSATDRVTITASNTAPAAVVMGEAPCVATGFDFALDGAASSDADGHTLTFDWAVVAQPTGAAADIDDAASPSPSLLVGSPGEYEIRLRVSDGVDTTEAMLPLRAFDREMSSSIASDTTLCRLQVPYVVTYFMRVDALLTVDPGVTIEFEENAGFDVYAGALSAVGTEEEPIRFTGAEETPGFWRGIDFDGSADGRNELAWVDVGYAGGAAISVFDGHVSVSNSHIHDATGPGVAVDGRSTLGFSANRLTSNGAAPVRIHARLMASLDGATDYHDPAAPNGAEYIDVIDGWFSDNIIEASTWSRLEVPYRVAEGFDINAHVTIEAGAHLQFAADAGIQVAPGSSDHPGGALTAVGTASDPIILEGTTATPGHWRGLKIVTADERNRLEHVHIGHAGSAQWLHSDRAAALTLNDVGESARLELSNSRIHHSGDAGLYVFGPNGTVTLPGFSSNRFESNQGPPVVVLATQMSMLDAATEYQPADAPNDSAFVLVNAGDLSYMDEGQLDTDAVTWQALSVPCRVRGGLELRGVHVTIEPGASFAMEQDAYVNVTSGPGDESNGSSLTAVGTAQDSIRFEGTSSAPGWWGGIGVYNTAVLDYVEIAHAGGRAWWPGTDPGEAPLYWHDVLSDAASLTGTNLHVRDHSGEYGAIGWGPSVDSAFQVSGTIEGGVFTEDEII